MSETTNLQLYKHDNPSTNTEQFDVEKSLNENWDKIDEAYGSNNIDIQELQNKVTSLEAKNAQLESQIPTGEASGNPIHLTDSSDLSCEIVVVGNAEQDGEPTPDAPVEVVTVGQNGSVEIDVVNKNLLNLKEYFKGEIAYGSSCEGYNVESNYMELMPAGTWSNIDVYISGLKANTDYTISANFLETIASSSIVGFTLMGNSEKSAQGSTGLGNNNGSVSKSVKTFKEFTFNTKDYAYIIIRFYANWSATSITKGNSLVKISEIQLEVGEKATEYEDHKEHKLVLPIQKEFVKIGDYEDTFIKQDGKWYERHLNNKLILDGSEAWTVRTDVNNENTVCFRNTLRTAPYDNMKYNAPLLSDSLKCNTTFDDYEHIRYMGSEGYRIQILLNKTRATTVDEFKTLLSSNNITIYYVLETPELIPCTEEQEQILNSFHTYKNITNISASGIATVKVIYRKDLETLFNNINSAIVALGGV